MSCQNGAGAARSQQHLARQKSRSQPSSSLSDIPAYYFEWAETIRALPGHEQGATLAAMPDDDAATIQRILRHRTTKRASFEETESAIMAEAQRRSLRWDSAKDLRAVVRQPLPSLAPDSRLTEALDKHWLRRLT